MRIGGDRGALHPQEGVRFLLERRSVEQDESVAHYRAAVFTPDQSFEYDAVLRSDGEASLDARGPAAPADVEEKLRAHARTLARGAARKRADGLPPWPHRVLRWRGPGRG